MDGTLTVPVLDFVEMRRRVGIPTGDILDVIATYPPERRAAALKVVEDVETEALARLQVQPGCLDLCSWLDGLGIPRGLITRNVRAAVDHFHERHWPLAPFRPALAREFLPYKPHPAALLHVCAAWGIPPHEAVIVGDSAPDDVVCGNRAGAATILLDSNGIYPPSRELEGEQCPTARAESLAEVGRLLREHFELVPPGAPAPPTADQPASSTQGQGSQPLGKLGSRQAVE